MISWNFENTDADIRQKVKYFLGSNYKANLYDKLDEFTSYTKQLYSASKQNTFQVG